MRWNLTGSVAAAALVLAATGCSRGVAWLDKQDQELPLVQRAAERASEGDIDSAVRLYEKALLASPDAARAHLDLAFLLHDFRKDYVGAIYHYRQYLDQRPGTEKQAMVAERIRLAEQLFAADVLGPSRLMDRAAALERENADLKTQLEALSQRVIERVQPQIAESTTTLAKAEPLEQRHIAGRAVTTSTYQVRSGDTLTSIASKVYGDGNRWKEIQLANSDILGNSSQVRVGQVLVIP